MTTPHTLGQIAMAAFWRHEVPPDRLTKAEVAERWEEAAHAVKDAIVTSCQEATTSSVE